MLRGQNRNRHIQGFRPRATRRSPDGCRLARIQTRAQPHIARIRTTFIGRIKAHPTKPRNEQLCPGMSRLMRRPGSALLARACSGRFDISHDQTASVPSVKFTLFDVLGRIVRQEARTYNNRFDILREDLKAGVYLYRLEDDRGRVKMGKLLME